MSIAAGHRPALIALLDENRRRLVAELGPEIRAFEARYELRSEDLQQALSDGRLADTSDVCDWLIAWETFRAVSPRPARLE